MDYYPFVPHEEELDNYTFVSETLPNGRRVMWAVEKAFKPARLDQFGFQHGLPPRMAAMPGRAEADAPSWVKEGFGGELRERTDDPAFCVHEMSRLAFLASVVWQKGGPGLFDFKDSPQAEGLVQPTGKCFAGGHDVYRPGHFCYKCNNQFCQDHIDFLLDKWCCRACGQRLQLKALGG